MIGQRLVIEQHLDLQETTQTDVNGNLKGASGIVFYMRNLFAAGKRCDEEAETLRLHGGARSYWVS